MKYKRWIWDLPDIILLNFCITFTILDLFFIYITHYNEALIFLLIITIYWILFLFMFPILNKAIQICDEIIHKLELNQDLEESITKA